MVYGRYIENSMIHGGYDVFVFSLKPTYNLGAPSYGFVFLCFFCCSFSEEHVEWYRISWHIWYNWWYLSWGWRIMPTKIWKYLWHVPYSTYITYIYISISGSFHRGFLLVLQESEKHQAAHTRPLATGPCPWEYKRTQPMDPNSVWEGTSPPNSYHPKDLPRRYLDP